MSDEELALAAAVKSVALANSLMWVSVAKLLVSKEVTTEEQFARLAKMAIDVLEVEWQTKDIAGLAMLRELHRILTDPAASAAPPSWTPTVVPGGKAN